MAERESRLQRLKDNMTALPQRYADLLKCACVGSDTQQQVGELQSSVLTAGMVRRATGCPAPVCVWVPLGTESMPQDWCRSHREVVTQLSHAPRRGAL